MVNNELKKELSKINIMPERFENEFIGVTEAMDVAFKLGYEGKDPQSIFKDIMKRNKVVKNGKLNKTYRLGRSVKKSEESVIKNGK